MERSSDRLTGDQRALVVTLTEEQTNLLRQLVACTTWEQAKVVSRQVEAQCAGIEYSIGTDMSDPEFRRVRVELPPEVMAAIGHPVRETPAPDPEPPRWPPAWAYRC